MLRSSDFLTIPRNNEELLRSLRKFSDDKKETAIVDEFNEYSSLPYPDNDIKRSKNFKGQTLSVLFGAWRSHSPKILLLKELPILLQIFRSDLTS